MQRPYKDAAARGSAAAPVDGGGSDIACSGVKEAPTPLVAHPHGTRQPRWGPRAPLAAVSPRRKAGQSPTGRRISQQANAGGRKAEGIHNLPDRGYPQPERALTWEGWFP